MLKVRNLSKVFRIPHVRKKTLFHSLLSLVTRTYEYEEFFALHDMNFQVPRGQFVGIIGRNGSGKSTLLKILARIYRPTSGEVELNDEVFPLLELGVGFQHDFTVRDNIFLYGSLLGFSRNEMKKRVNQVLEFAELKRFADARLERLSTGMQVRLAFAVATQSDAPVMLVDEVLAVGDTIFQQKCRKVFREYKESGKTILFVSHDMASVREYCDRTLVMNDGNLMYDGPPETAIRFYEEQVLQIR